jgi:hypothetical protein
LYVGNLGATPPPPGLVGFLWGADTEVAGRSPTCEPAEKDQACVQVVQHVPLVAAEQHQGGFAPVPHLAAFDADAPVAGSPPRVPPSPIFRHPARPELPRSNRRRYLFQDPDQRLPADRSGQFGRLAWEGAWIAECGSRWQSLGVNPPGLAGGLTAVRDGVAPAWWRKAVAKCWDEEYPRSAAIIVIGMSVSASGNLACSMRSRVRY